MKAAEAKWKEEKEKGASQQLRLARDVFAGTAEHFRDKNYQRAYDLLDRAEERCHGVMRDYPDSPTVAKAQELLKEIAKERQLWKRIERNPWILP